MNSILLSLHIAGGSIAILSGLSALIARKGRKFHAKAGSVFYYSMLVMASTATVLSLFETTRTNTIVGLLTVYLVVTARKAALNRKGSVSSSDRLWMIYAFAVLILGIFFSLETVKAKPDSLNALDYFLFFYTGMAGLGGVLDLVMVIRKKILGPKRIARHVWRMSFALWIACGSLFLGQPQVFPAPFDQLMVRAIPVLFVVVMWFFWNVYVFFDKRFKINAP